MKRYRHLPATLAALAALAAVVACGDRDLAHTSATTGMRQTAFPGMVTAGGGSSGAVMGRAARPETDATCAGGTPGIAGGSGGTTGGAATAGTTANAGSTAAAGSTAGAGATATAGAAGLAAGASGSAAGRGNGSRWRIAAGTIASISSARDA